MRLSLVFVIRGREGGREEGTERLPSALRRAGLRLREERISGLALLHHGKERKEGGRERGKKGRSAYLPPCAAPACA